MTNTTQATRALIEEVRQVHITTTERAFPQGPPGVVCASCRVFWPCPTIRLADALEAAQADTQGNVTAAVLQAVRSERERQDTQWGGPEHDDGHWPDDWRRFRQRFERKAQHALDGQDSQAAHAALVKIAALAIAQIESLSRQSHDWSGGEGWGAKAVNADPLIIAALERAADLLDDQSERLRYEDDILLANLYAKTLREHAELHKRMMSQCAIDGKSNNG